MPADLITRLLLQNQEFDRNLKESRAQVQAFQKRVDVMGASVKSFVAGFAGMAGVSFAFMDVAQKSMAFEKSLSSLRALTGVSAKELDFFKQEAIKMGSTSMQTASQVVDAFKLIGSQKPELLKNKEALAEVTNQAIILAEAAEMDVPEAAKALTGSLNQMGESANKAGEYINILAAASQAGSADIPYLTKAIEKSGGASSSVGVKYHELVAAIEAIAPKVTEASEAGTSLRNIFLMLEASSDKNLKPSVVGLSSALENLSAKNYDATQMTKIFGRENVTAALALVKAKDEYLNYTEVITGTNTALDQQKINNDNLAGSLKSLSSSWEGFVLSLNKSNGQLKQTSDFVSAILRRITETMKSEEQKQQEVIAASVKKEKSDLDRVVQSWMDYGDSRAEAISKTMDQQNRNNGGGVGYANQLREEERKLKSMENSLKQYEPKTGFDTGLHSTVPYSHLSVGGVYEKNKTEEQIESQKALIAEVNRKNETYKRSIQYLNEELKAASEVKKVTATGGGVVTDDMRKQWKDQDQKDKKEASFQFLTDKAGYDIRSQLYKIGQSTDLTIPVIVKPEYEISDETSDIKGSVSDVQQRIQDTTLAYNEATTDGLRALYAQQRADLEEHLQGMTDINQGMIDISSELNSLIQSGVVSSFESLGEAIGSGDMGDAMRSMLMGLMDILKQFGAALIATGLAAEALKKVTVNPYLAIAAGGALIIAATAAKSSLNKVGSYAEGGITPYYTVGDRMVAGINGGEMILNTKQQAKLFDLLDMGRTQLNNNRLEISGRLVGEGSQLRAVLEYCDKKQRRGR